MSTPNRTWTTSSSRTSSRCPTCLARHRFSGRAVVQCCPRAVAAELGCCFAAARAVAGDTGENCPAHPARTPCPAHLARKGFTLTTFSGARDGVLVAVAAVKTRRIDLHVPRNGSVRGAGTGLEPSLGYDCSRCRGSLPATMNEWLPARVMCVSSPRYHGIPCGAPRCPNSCYIYGRPERDADYLPTV